MSKSEMNDKCPLCGSPRRTDLEKMLRYECFTVCNPDKPDEIWMVGYECLERQLAQAKAEIEARRKDNAELRKNLHEWEYRFNTYYPEASL